MGKLINGINGPIKGKVGPTHGSSRNGNPYIKGPHKKRTTKISKKEKGNRTRFNTAQFWLKPLLDFVREGFKGFTYKPASQGHAAAKSYLLTHAVEGEAPEFTVNPALAKVSYGSLPLPENMRVEKYAEQEIKFSWDKDWSDALAKGAHYADQAMLLAYDIEHKKAFMSLFGEFRKSGEQILRVSYYKKSKIYTNGGTFHCYLAFVAADRSRQSDSEYLGTITFS